MYTVYALDLLGFGESDKPPGFAYTMEGWAQVHPAFRLSIIYYIIFFLMMTELFSLQLILDFLDEVIKKPTVLVGNSVGSLACVIAASGHFGYRMVFSFLDL